MFSYSPAGVQVTDRVRFSCFGAAPETTVSGMAFWIHLAAGKHPDRVAIEGPERTLTYAELSEEATAAASALQGLGARPGSLVAIALPPGEDFVIALHGCLLCGAAAVPIDLRLSEDEQALRTAG